MGNCLGLTTTKFIQQIQHQCDQLEEANKKLKEETEGFMNLLASYCDKIKKEHQKLCFEQQATLIANIAKGENLNELDLREKYLTTKSKPPEKKPEEKIDEEFGYTEREDD